MKRFVNAFRFLAVLLIFVLLFTNTVLASNILYWAEKSPLNIPRAGASATFVNGKVYVVGGTTPATKIVEIFDPLTNTWTAGAPMAMVRYKFGLVTGPDQKVYAIGGETDGWPLSTVEMYDPAINSWTSRSPMPTPRGELVAALGGNGKIYAFGGHCAYPDPSCPYSTVESRVEEYDPATDTWSRKSDIPIGRWQLGATSAPNGKIYLIGGGTFRSSSENLVQEYDPFTDTWSQKASMNIPRRLFGLATGSDGKIYVYGGLNGSTILSSVESYDPNTDSWSFEPDMPTARYYLAGAATDNGKLYAISGNTVINGAEIYLGTVEEAVITLPNLPPSVDAGGPYYVNEGEMVQVSATGVDPENGLLTYDWDLDNNGSFETTGQTVTFSAAILDGPDNKTIAVQVTDEGNLTATDQTIVFINNVAPTVGTITAPVDPLLINSLVSTHVSFTDPGIADTHLAIWEWGDTSTSLGIVDQVNDTVSNNHTYATPGVYELKITVTDDDGSFDESIYQFVVVYDNTASSGFVTGAGIIDSPLGAYTQDSSLTGIARFGFISKYQTGANVPIGETQFRFQVAQFAFQSTSYDWLVVAGPQAKYKGSGTVNGSGNYGFLLSATDGDINGGGGVDKFRIKIWDKDNGDTIVYDNQLAAGDNADPTTSLSGGNIVIHQ